MARVNHHQRHQNDVRFRDPEALRLIPGTGSELDEIGGLAGRHTGRPFRNRDRLRCWAPLPRRQGERLSGPQHDEVLRPGEIGDRRRGAGVWVRTGFAVRRDRERRQCRAIRRGVEGHDADGVRSAGLEAFKGVVCSGNRVHERAVEKHVVAGEFEVIDRSTPNDPERRHRDLTCRGPQHDRCRRGRRVAQCSHVEHGRLRTIAGHVYGLDRDLIRRIRREKEEEIGCARRRLNHRSVQPHLVPEELVVVVEGSQVTSKAVDDSEPGRTARPVGVDGGRRSTTSTSSSSSARRLFFRHAST